MRHARRALRRWRCRCGARWPCGARLAERDAATREIDPDGPAGVVLTGWTVRAIGRR